MPTRFRIPAHALWAPGGSSWPRRLVSAIRGALVMALMMCAVIHGTAEETHDSRPVPAAASTIAAGGEPHGSHGPHGAEDCASNMVVRAAAQSLEKLPLGAMAVVVLVAASAVVGRPCGTA